MQMHRHPELPDVLKDRQKLRGVNQHIGDVRKDLKATESELPDTAVDLCNRSPRVSKANTAKPNEFAWIVSNDPCQIIVEALCPLICVAAAKHVRSKRTAVTQYRDVDFHVVHGTQLLIHVDDRWDRGYIESGRTLDDIHAAIEHTLGQAAATHQMLDKIE